MVWESSVLSGLVVLPVVVVERFFLLGRPSLLDEHSWAVPEPIRLSPREQNPSLRRVVLQSIRVLAQL